MNRQETIELLNSNNVGMVAYQWYVEKQGKLPYMEFMNLFQIFSMQNNVADWLQSLLSVLEINILRNKDGTINQYL